MFVVFKEDDDGREKDLEWMRVYLRVVVGFKKRQVMVME